MNYKFNKVVVDEMFKCYSVNHLPIDGDNKLIFAGEGPGVCAVYDQGKKVTLWDDSYGGTMSVVPVRDKKGYFYISTGFYSMVDATTSEISLIHYNNEKFTKRNVCYVPYLHRFGVLRGYKDFIVACSIATHKKDKEDWNHPGKIFVGEIDEDIESNSTVLLDIIYEGLTQNHGFTVGEYDGHEAAFIGAKEGFYVVVPPKSEDDEWTIEKIMNEPISDAMYLDLDGDGESEIAGFTPFHGDSFEIFKKIDGQYQSVYKYPLEMGFYHAIDSYKINGVNTLFVGARKDAMQLFMIQYDKENEEYVTQVIDELVGPSNVHVFDNNGKLTIMSANRQINQAALYELEE